MHEVTLFFDERDDADAGASMIAWTAGMQKFGRPNLLIADIERDYAALRPRSCAMQQLRLPTGTGSELGDTLTIGDRTFLASPLPANHNTPIDGIAIALLEIVSDTVPASDSDANVVATGPDQEQL